VDYPTFALTLSVFAVIEYLVLSIIAVRRRMRHAIRLPLIEERLMVVLLVVSLATLISAAYLGRDPESYPDVARVAMSIVRGMIVMEGVITGARYWTVRNTWL
jgi:hypothetical protein